MNVVVRYELAILAALAAWNPACVSSAQTERLNVIADSALANRKAFPFVDCRFTLRHGKCSADQDPLAAAPLRVKLTAAGVWVVRKEQLRHEIEVDPSIEQEHLSKAISSQAKTTDTRNKTFHVDTDMKFVSRKIVWDGAKGMTYSPLISGGGLLPPDTGSPGITVTPFDLVGMMGRDECRHPGVLLAASKTKKGASCRLDGTEIVRGRNLLVVAYEETFGADKVRSKYWFDPERGFLPVQMTKQAPISDHIHTRVVVTDVRECSGGRWFPMRSVKVLSPGPGAPEKDLDVIELTVTQLAADSPPSDEILAIEIPKGARLHNGVDPQSQSTLQQQERIGIADLGSVGEEMGRRAKERRIQYEQQSAVLGMPTSIANWVAIVVCTALLCIAVVLMWRRRRRQGISQ